MNPVDITYAGSTYGVEDCTSPPCDTYTNYPLGSERIDGLMEKSGQYDPPKGVGKVTLTVAPGYTFTCDKSSSSKFPSMGTQKVAHHGALTEEESKVPLVMAGPGVQKIGIKSADSPFPSGDSVLVTDIAPTIACLLEVPYPSGGSTHPLADLLGVTCL